LHTELRQPTDATQFDAIILDGLLPTGPASPVHDFPPGLDHHAASVVPHLTPSAPQEEDEPEDFADLVLELADDSHFQSGNDVPRIVAALKGTDLIQLLDRPPPTIPTIAKAGLVKTTRQEHLRMLSLLKQLLQDSAVAQLPLTTAVAEVLQRCRRAKRWRWSTALKYLCTAQGALALLPLYRQVQTPVLLKHCPVWGQVLRATAGRARQELPQQPRATSWPEMKMILESEPNTQIFCALLIGWFTAARLGCVLQLRRPDLTLHPDERTVDVRFTKGKGVKARGPYTVRATPMPPTMFARLTSFLAQRPAHLFTTDITGASLKMALRRGNPENEQRSVRRGALQALAKAPGMTLQALMAYSGHTQERTLLRYLNWGTKADFLAVQERTAAGSALTTLPAQ
jgi:integrase